jgi:putative aldouronate transport system substrate-binding protein
MSNDTTAKNYSRRRFVRLAALGAAALPVGGAILAACGDAATPTTGVTTAAAAATTAANAATSAAASAATTAASATTSAATTAASSATTAAGSATTAAAAGAGYLKSPAAGVPDGYTTAPAPFKATTGIPGKGGTVRVFMISYAAPPPPREENKYWQELEKRLGVKWEITLAPQNTYAEKLGVITAGGDLPELTFLDLGQAPEQFKTIQQGAYTDLTAYLTGDALKEYPNLAAYPDLLWKNVAIKGKIFGVPRPRYLVGSANQYRQDWLDNLGIAAPKNADEFYSMMEAFTKKKPEPTQPNTWGMGFTQGEFSSQTVFMHMFKVPNTWKLDGSGNLSYYIEAPEYKEAVAYMAKLWKAGFIYPDSVSQSKQQSQDNFVAGKYGVWQDSLTGYPGPTGRHATALGINSKANILPYFPPGADGGKPVSWLGSGYFGFAAIPAKIGKDQAKAKELLNILNWLASPFGSEEYTFYNFGVDNADNTIQPDGSRVLNDTGKKEIGDLPKIANGNQVLYYPGFPEQPKVMQDIIQTMLAVGISNPALTAVSTTWNSKSKVLNQLVEDRIVRIVTGSDSIDALDTLVKDWKSQGGSQVAQEFAASIK